ncbi:hypothetical protein C471_07435 [Halorubrum saccharovorum DSM 1137]|uniref:Uncharacterized protein n=1 Tax=Halorubrum saccharovorum DSM 1137 TaxID=1227484 RepID=M0E249_9EURY|nr:hypothetical protein C471_07435 [Halorubrum saccharovorum DSM 1137]
MNEIVPSFLHVHQFAVVTVTQNLNVTQFLQTLCVTHTANQFRGSIEASLLSEEFVKDGFGGEFFDECRCKQEV